MGGGGGFRHGGGRAAIIAGGVPEAAPPAVDLLWRHQLDAHCDRHPWRVSPLERELGWGDGGAFRPCPGRALPSLFLSLFLSYSYSDSSPSVFFVGIAIRIQPKPTQPSGAHPPTPPSLPSLPSLLSRQVCDRPLCAKSINGDDPSCRAAPSAPRAAVRHCRKQARPSHAVLFGRRQVLGEGPPQGRAARVSKEGRGGREGGREGGGRDEGEGWHTCAWRGRRRGLRSDARAK